MRLANDTTYGLASYIQSKDIARARAVARRTHTGNVPINYPAPDLAVRFGGYRQSGNGRGYAEFGLEDLLEIKRIIGNGANRGTAFEPIVERRHAAGQVFHPVTN